MVGVRTHFLCDTRSPRTSASIGGSQDSIKRLHMGVKPISEIPIRSRMAVHACAALVALWLASCATTSFQDRVVRPAVDLPTAFMMDEGGALVPADNDGLCRNPMVDPRDGRRLALVRSVAGFGDYEVSEGSYGVASKELLRVDCDSGKALGIVER